MDDRYLTKPLDISRLQDVLDRFMGAVSSDTRADGVASMSRNLDESLKARLQEIAGDDEEFARRAGQRLHHERARKRFWNVRAAAHRQDLDQLARAAHKLKGAANNLHVDRLGLRHSRRGNHAREAAVATIGVKS